MGPWPRRLLLACAVLTVGEVGLLHYLPAAAVTTASLWLAWTATGVLIALAGLWILFVRLIRRWQRRLNASVRREATTVTELRAQVAHLTDKVNDQKVAEQALETSVEDSESTIAALQEQMERFEPLRDELARMKEEAFGREQAKTAFLVRIARELRSPLTAILGLAHTLIHEGNLALAPPDRVEAIYTIRQKGEHLLALVNEVIELSELESGAARAAPTRCQLRELLGEVEASIRVWAEAKAITLAVEHSGQLPETIETDATRMQRILLNIVGNAVKYTDSGGVRILVRLTQGDQEQPQLQFDVVDTGIGMTREQRERLFQPFGMVGPDHDHRLHGPGLGLTISKQYAKQLGGDLELIDTGPGLGTRFRLSIDTGDLDGVRLFEFGTPVETPAETHHAPEPTPT